MLHIFLVLAIQWLLGYHPPATELERSNTMKTERIGGWTGVAVWRSAAYSLMFTCRRVLRRLSATWPDRNPQFVAFFGEPQIARI
jgi:hypothetical protein